MTYSQREEILSKEALSVEDFQALLGLPYQTAAMLIRNIKYKSDRLGLRGYIHRQDYLDYYNLNYDTKECNNDSVCVE